MASLLSLAACAPAKEPISKPTLVILGPVEGARFKVGEPIGATFSAVGRGKLLKIVVTINDGEEQSRQIDPPETVVTIGMSLSTRNTGRLVLSAAAIDAAGERSAPAVVNIIVGDVTEPASAANSGSNAEAGAQPAGGAPTGGAAAPSTGSAGCTLAAQYVSDISIPDGTQVQPGGVFVKTWRMRNTSTCDWPAGFKLAFFEDEPMSKSAVGNPLPALAKDQDFDVSVELTAPQTKGVYTSTWRLRDTTGTSFGNRVYVSIRVP